MWTFLVNFAIQLIFRLQAFCSVHAIISTSVVIFRILSLILWTHLRCALNYWSIIFFNYLFILLYNIVLVLPYIDLNPPWVCMCSIIFDTSFLRDIFWQFFFLWIGHIFLFLCMFCEFLLMLKTKAATSLNHWRQVLCKGWTSRVCPVLWNQLVWRL